MSQTVLLVDDEPNVVKSLGRTLRKEGYTLISASNGTEGLELLQNNQVDLVITDQRMPELSGSEMVAEMRKQNKFLPAIMLSGQSDLDDVVHAINEGKIHSYIKKPWDRDALLSKVKSALIKGERAKQLEASAAFFTDSNQPGWVMDQKGDICFANEEFNSRFIKESLMDSGSISVLNIRSLLRKDQVIQLKRLCEISKHNDDAEGHLIFLLPDASESPHKVLVRNIEVNETCYYCLQFVNDLEVCLLKQELDRLHKFDPCTGLLNRSTLISELQQQIDAYPGEHFALGVIEVRHGDDLRNSLGEDGFEHLLYRVGQRLEFSSRLIGRIGDNRFCALFGPYQYTETLENWTAELREVFQSAFEFGAQCVPVRPAIGMALYPQEASSVTDLMDIALRSCKSVESSTITPWISSLDDGEHFSNAVGAVVACKSLMRNSIARAIEQKQLRMQYQPTYCALTHSLVGIDATLRSLAPGNTQFPLEEFLSHPENTQLACQLDKWIFSQALNQILEWRQNGYKDFYVSVAMSAAWINSDNLEREILAMVFDKAIDPSKVWIQISESAFVDLSDTVIANLDMLKSRGFHLVLDRFGSGISSAKMMAELPIDGVRIDRSVLEDMDRSDKHFEIASSMINLADKLDLSIMANDVDTKKHFDMLRSLDVPMLCQGRFFSTPTDASALEGELQLYKEISI